MPHPTHFSQDEIDALYELITSCNGDLISMLAKSAVKQALEVKADMWNDADDEIQRGPLFNEDDVKAQAHDYSADMLNDFASSVKGAIKALRLDAGIHRVVKFEVKFVD